MNKKIILFAALGAAFICSQFRKSVEVVELVSTVKNSVSTPLGVRLNNPLNIRKSGTAWEGKQDTGKSSEFEEFSAPKFGFRAAARIIRTYQSKYRINTISGIINRWAPPSENDTENYISFVSQKMNISENAALDAYNNDVLTNLIYAMSIMEVGRHYSVEDARQGVAIA